MKISLKSLFLILIIIIFISSTFFNVYINVNTNSSKKITESNKNFLIDNYSLNLAKISGKIHIKDNWSDVRAADICNGSGTYYNPYVIEDLIIDGGGSGSGILIENSEEYFVLKNCTIFNSGITWNDAGIRLLNVDNSQLINNTCLYNYYGIYLNDCKNNSILENKLYRQQY